MKSGSGYLSIDVKPPLKGLATSFPSDELPEQFSPSLENVVIREGIVTRRAGGSQLGQQLVGKVLAFANFAPLGTTPYLVVFTSRRQYYYDQLTAKFIDITMDQLSYPITAISVVDSYFEIAGDHTIEFTVGADIPVVGGVNEGIYTVVSVSLVAGNTQIVTSPASPTSTVAGSIVLAGDLTTAATDQINFAILTDITSHRLLMTNGRDVPRFWNGDTGFTFNLWTPTYTDFVTCKTLCVFNEHLFLGNLVLTGAVTEPVSVAWSKAGDFEEFEDGDAGVQILYQLVTELQAMNVLGDRIAINSADTLVTGMYNGLPAVFIFETVIPQGTRLAAAKAITTLNVGHVFISEENFYLFDGTRGLRELGTSIYSDYKTTKDFQYLYRASALTDFSKKTMYFAVPDGDESTTIYTARYDIYNLADITWAKEKYYDDVSAWGFFINDSTVIYWEDAAWETVDSPWSNELGSWNEEGERLNFPIRVYGTSSGRVVLVTEGAMLDRGNSVYQRYETKDFVAFEPSPTYGTPIAPRAVLGRWGEIEFEAKGSGVTVSYSLDQGSTWTEVQDVTLTGQWTNYQLPIDVSSRQLRLRFDTTTEVFSLRAHRVWFKPGGPQ